MRVALLAAMLVAAGGASQAATMTFDGLPDEGGASSTWVEDGITADGSPYVVAYEGTPGTAHLDDSGTGFARSLTFTMDVRFDARSFDILPVGSDYVSCADESLTGCEPLGFENVAVTGYRDGEIVAEDVFDMFAVGTTYVFDEAFSNLDSLVIGFAPPPFEGFLPDGRFATCRDAAPCTHFDIDNVALAPIPLPASALLLVAALGGLGVARRRRA